MTENNQTTLPSDSTESSSEAKKNASDFLDSLKSIKSDEKFLQMKLLYSTESATTARKNLSDDVIVNNNSSQKKGEPNFQKRCYKRTFKEKIENFFSCFTK